MVIFAILSLATILVLKWTKHYGHESQRDGKNSLTKCQWKCFNAAFFFVFWFWLWLWLRFLQRFQSLCVVAYIVGDAYNYEECIDFRLAPIANRNDIVHAYYITPNEHVHIGVQIGNSVIDTLTLNRSIKNWQFICGQRWYRLIDCCVVHVQCTCVSLLFQLYGHCQ